MARMDDTNVTAREPAISGIIPNSGGEETGYHSFPPVNWTMDASRRIGIPSFRRKKRMNAITHTPDIAVTVMTARGAVSPILLFFPGPGAVMIT
jgi:hypothetical protein